MELQLKFFDPSTIGDAKVVFMIGRRGTGKSTVAADIMSHKTHIKQGVVVSETDRMNRFWHKHVPSVFIHHKYRHSITEKLLLYQEKKWMKYVRECRKKGVKAVEGKIDPIFAVYDDVTYDRSFFRNQAIRRLMMNGRHYNIFVVITVQYMMDIAADIRGMIDYVVLLKDNNRSHRIKIFEHFAGMFPSQAAFDATMRACTQDREAMVLDNTCNSYDIEDCVFFYKARPDLEFKLGSKRYWAFADENGNESDSEDDGPASRFQSGMSKRDQDKVKDFEVQKLYPEDEGDNVNSFSVAKRPTGSYGALYRSRTRPLSLAVKPRVIVGKKKPHQRTMWRKGVPEPEPILGVENASGPRLQVSTISTRARAAKRKRKRVKKMQDKLFLK